MTFSDRPRRSAESCAPSSLPLRVGFVLPWTVVGGGELATLRLARALTDPVTASDRPFAVDTLSYIATGPEGRSDVAAQYRAAGLDTVSYAPAEYSYRYPVPY